MTPPRLRSEYQPFGPTAIYEVEINPGPRSLGIHCSKNEYNPKLYYAKVMDPDTRRSRAMFSIFLCSSFQIRSLGMECVRRFWQDYIFSWRRCGGAQNVFENNLNPMLTLYGSCLCRLDIFLTIHVFDDDRTIRSLQCIWDFHWWAWNSTHLKILNRKMSSF